MSPAPFASRRALLASGAALALAGCAPTSLLNVIEASDSVAVARDVAFAEGARRRLDVYRPAGVVGAPVVVFFYGGSWQNGDKARYAFVGEALAKRGYVAILPNYRLYPETSYPGFVEDGALALRWAKQNAARLGGAPSKLFVAGHSAGAYIAAMLAADARFLAAVGMAPRRDLAGLIGVSGPYDFLPLQSARLATIFGGANRRETQPIAHVSGDEPPALLLTGADDSVVEPGNTTRFAEALRRAGVAATARVYPGVGHVATVGSFSLRAWTPALDDVSRFVDQIAGRGGRA